MEYFYYFRWKFYCRLRNGLSFEVVASLLKFLDCNAAAHQNSFIVLLHYCAPYASESHHTTLLEGSPFQYTSAIEIQSVLFKCLYSTGHLVCAFSSSFMALL